MCDSEIFVQTSYVYEFIVIVNIFDSPRPAKNSMTKSLKLVWKKVFAFLTSQGIFDNLKVYA